MDNETNIEVPELSKVQQLALLDEVTKSARKIIDALGLAEKVTVERSPDDDCCDPYVQIGAFMVMVQNVAVPGIGGPRVAARYFVGHEVTIPGCHTLPNGDPGYPDDADYVEDSDAITGADNAAEDAIKRDLAHAIDMLFQNWREAEMWKESEKEWEEMAKDLAEKEGNEG